MLPRLLYRELSFSKYEKMGISNFLSDFYINIFKTFTTKKTCLIFYSFIQQILSNPNFNETKSNTNDCE